MFARQMTVAAAWWFASIGLQSLNGQMIFDDSRAYVLQGSFFEQVIVRNQSRLDLQGAIACPEHQAVAVFPPVLVVDDATVEVNGGATACLTFLWPDTDGGSVTLDNSSEFTLNDGQIRGLIVRDSKVVVNGGSVQTVRGFTVPIDATGLSSVIVNGGDVRAERFMDSGGIAISAGDTTTVVINGGTVDDGDNGDIGAVALRDSATLQVVDGRTSGVAASGESYVQMTGGVISTFRGIGFRLTEASTLEMTGGNIISGRAIQLSGDARLKMTGGDIELSASNGPFGCVGIAASDSAAAKATNIHIGRGGDSCYGYRYVSAEGDATLELLQSAGEMDVAIAEGLFEADGSAGMLIRNGHFDTKLTYNRPSLLNASVFRAQGSAQMTVDGGDYGTTLPTDLIPTVNVNVFSARDQAELNIEHGTFQMKGQEDLPASLVRAVYATGESRTKIHGGDFEFSTQFAEVRHLEVRDRATVTLFGSDFNFSLLEPIQLLEGTVKGTLADGNLIDWTFQRDATASIILLPDVAGDYNRDGVLNELDLDQQAIGMNAPHPDISRYDENGDGAVDVTDRMIWVHEYAGTWVGDTNLDGKFNSSDLVAVLAAGEYEDDLIVNSGWAAGDWNGDGDFTSADLVVALADGGYEQELRAAVSVVPEPASSVMLMLGLIGIRFCRRQVDPLVSIRRGY